MAMAKQSTARPAASLRALTYRISSCPPKQLPYIAPQVAASLWNCRTVLAAPGDTAKSSSESSQTVNRFRTCVSQLLQARSAEERWAAVVLAKAAVEAGRLEVVSKATGWTKNLVAILKKSDPSTSKVLAIITLTRIFMLTWEDTTLVREITTPALPGFVQACLTAVEKREASGGILQTVLEAFATLLPRHPTIFRTYEGQIRALVLKILSATSSVSDHERCYGSQSQKSARRLFALLHHCAPKQGGPGKWDETLGAAVSAAHTTCDRILRSVNEGWTSTAGVVKTSTGAAGEVSLISPDAIGLSAWQGVHAGAERLVTLIQMLQTHLESATSGITTMRLGLVMDLLRRVLELDASMRDQPAYANAQSSKEEREELFDVLPDVHIAALELLQSTLRRFGDAALSQIPHMLDMLSANFSADSPNVRLRTAAYQLLNAVIDRIGPSMPKDSIHDIIPVIRSCCEDLLPASTAMGRTSGMKPDSLASGSRESLRRAPSHATRLAELDAAASDLLLALFAKLDQSLLPARLRARMEQTAVLTEHKDALVACVLNPPRKGRDTALRASLLPLLARSFPNCAEVEALLRPRMPVVGAVRETKVRTEDDVESEDGAESFDEGEAEGDGKQTGVDYIQNGDDVELTGLTGSSNGVAERELEPEDVVKASGGAVEKVSSTAPERAIDTVSSPQRNKRPAAETEQLEAVDAKRLRASPVASTLVSEPTQSLPGPAPSTIERASAPIIAVPQGSGESQAAVLPAANITASAESDDSDFEIPPLTMESDSEEGEGGDDGFE